MEDKLSKTFACVEDESGSSVTCTFTDEGHTLGNVLRYAITKKYCVPSAQVTFCGYSVPHPAESVMNVRVQTAGERALDTVEEGLEDVVRLCNALLEMVQQS